MIKQERNPFENPKLILTLVLLFPFFGAQASPPARPEIVCYSKSASSEPGLGQYDREEAIFERIGNSLSLRLRHAGALGSQLFVVGSAVAAKSGRSVRVSLSDRGGTPLTLQSGTTPLIADLRADRSSTCRVSSQNCTHSGEFYLSISADGVPAFTRGLEVGCIVNQTR